MIRVLTMIAIAGFVLSVASLSAAFALGGPDLISRGSWEVLGSDSRWGHHHGRHGAWAQADLGPSTTRTMAWSGAQRLEVGLPADVRYIQQDGAATVELTGPEGALKRVEIHGDTLAYQDRAGWDDAPRLTVVIRAPNIHGFEISGRNTLSIEGYRQPRLELEVSGEGEIKAAGETDAVTLDASGGASADLPGLKAKAADVEVSGSARSTIAPTESAKIEVSGAGEVTLATTPKSLETDITGGGRLHTQPAAAKAGGKAV